MKSAIAALLILVALPDTALAGTFTFKSCSADALLNVNVYNSNDPVKMFSSSSARNMRENDQASLNCTTEKCLVQVTTEFLAEQRNRVQHTLDDFAPDGGSVCFRIRASSWNVPTVRVSYGSCSC